MPGKLPTQQWIAYQHELAKKVQVEPLAWPAIVAGVDCAFTRTHAVSVAVRWDVANAVMLEHATVRVPLEVPYVSTFLSFREGPAVKAALAKLGPFEAVLIDGQGLAHPRRCGLATHVGVELDVPSIGVAKSRLIGEFTEPGRLSGDRSTLTHKGEIVGTVLRARDNTRPLFVSIGHRCDLESAVKLVMACRTRYRMPEPTRLADRLVAAEKKKPL